MSLQLFLEIGGFIVVVAGLVWSAGVARGASEKTEANLNTKIDQHIVDDQKIETALTKQMQKMWDWKDSHEKDASNMRLELQKQIGKIEGVQAIQQGQYGEILRLIEGMRTDISMKIEKLESQVEKFNKN